MEGYDPEKAARVWQRVQGRTAPAAAPAGQTRQEPALAELILLHLQDAAACAAVARRLGGSRAELLNRIYRQQRAAANSLRGIGRLRFGTWTRFPAIPAPREAPEGLLGRCCVDQLRLLEAYERQAREGQFAPIYAALAAQSREHCRAFAELLGSLAEA